MKTEILRRVYFLAMLVVLASCTKDDLDGKVNTLEEFKIETSGIPDEIVVSQFDTLSINPQISFDGPLSNLRYSWSIYLFDSDGNNPPDTLSSESKLSVPISLLPAKYYVEFSTEDISNGRKAFKRFNVRVEGIGSGIMALYERGGTVDVDLVRMKILDGALQSDIIGRSLFSIANPQYSLLGRPVSISMMSYNAEQRVNIFTDQDGLSLSAADMVISKPFAKMFALPPAVVKPEGLFSPIGITVPTNETSDGLELLVNDGQAYSNFVAFAGGRESAFSLLLSSDGPYRASPYVRYGLGRIIVYDQLKRRFMSVGPLSTLMTPLQGSGTAFDFKDIKRELVYMDYGFGGQYFNYAIFKDNNNLNKRFMYVMDFAGIVAKYVWDISAYPSIVDAKSFAFAQRAPLAYYANDRIIYRMKYDISSGEQQGTDVAWQLGGTSEKISLIKFCPVRGRNVTQNAREKYLFVCTYDETSDEGKIYVLDVDLTTGRLNSEPVNVFRGFGRIKDIAFKF